MNTYIEIVQHRHHCTSCLTPLLKDEYRGCVVRDHGRYYTSDKYCLKCFIEKLTKTVSECKQQISEAKKAIKKQKPKW